MRPNSLRVVLIGTTSSVFVTRTAETLGHYGFDVMVIDPYSSKEDRNRSTLVNFIKKITRVVKTVCAISRIESDRTAIIMSLPIHICWLTPLIKLRLRRVVGLAFGSDILRRVRRWDGWFGFGLRRLDVVAATNDNVMQAILDDFPMLSVKEHRVIRFGLTVFDELDALLSKGITPAEARRQLGYAPDRALISLGYAASPGQRQLELIEAFVARIDNFDGYDFVIPVQYGSFEVAEKVEAACDRVNAGLDTSRFHVLRAFHDPATSALMRRATTVLINHSITDAFSGTVQEVVYAGNIVLAGEHLPYFNMPGFGTAIRAYACLDDVYNMLAPEMLSDWNRIAREFEEVNRDALHATSSWAAVLSDWRTLIAPQGKLN